MRKSLAISSLLAIFSLASGQSSGVAFSQVPGFYNARVCVRWCLDNSYFGLDYQLQCLTKGCICRSDLRPQVSSALSACLFSSVTDCNNNNKYDLATAMEIYDDYCDAVTPAAGPVSSMLPSGIQSGSGGFYILLDMARDVERLYPVCEC
jgi:hypothetical protein